MAAQRRVLLNCPSEPGRVMMAGRCFALAAAGLSLAACSAHAGGLLGKAIGGGAGNRIAGTVIGAALDNEDKRRTYAAQFRALETGASGAPVAWRNPDSGRYGNVVHGPAYQKNGEPCRQYTHTVYIDGQPQTQRGTACRNPDGSWSTISQARVDSEAASGTHRERAPEQRTPCCARFPAVRVTPS